jgi:hypothetical protein
MPASAADRSGRLIGVLIVASLSIVQARTDAAVRGTDQGAKFAEGHELDTAASALISASAVDRMLSPEEAHDYFDRGS